jgi:UDP-glucuronate decarboxylase
MKKVLVAGGTGFLGSNLCGSLLEKNYKVIGLDNLYSSSLQNIQHFFTNKNFEFLNHDVTEPLFIEVDEIYNLACPASPVHYQFDPIQTSKTSFLGALNLLELATKTGAKILQASTSEVYGDPLVHPQIEDYWGNVNPIGIRSCYDEGKRIAESLFFDFHRMYGTTIKVARIFNTYGPNMSVDDGRVVSNFIVQALKGLPITMYGTGEQSRSFCYVSDLIHGMILLMESDKDVQGPVNLGNPIEFTMAGLVNELEHILERELPLVFEALPSDDPKMRKPNIDLAFELLRWKPEISLNEGLALTIKYFQQELQRQSQDE